MNVVSAWLLSSGGHDHGFGHGHGHDHSNDAGRRIDLPGGSALLTIAEDGVPPRFRLRPGITRADGLGAVLIETERPNGTRRVSGIARRDPGASCVYGVGPDWTGDDPGRV